MKVGFIGIGTMGGAVAAAVCESSKGLEYYFSQRSLEKAKEMQKKFGGVIRDNAEIGRECDVIFLGVKPQVIGTVLEEIAPSLVGREGVTLVSMAAGVKMERILELSGGGCDVIRMMPNTPLMVGSGVVQYCSTAIVDESEHLDWFWHWMNSVGVADMVPEGLMDACTAVSGCGPAFCAMFLEALADGGVLCGLPREKALKYAAQTMIGTAEMVLQKGMHPEVLKDGVCSPSGATIQGVAELEKHGFRSAGIEAVRASYTVMKKLGE